MSVKGERRPGSKTVSEVRRRVDQLLRKGYVIEGQKVIRGRPYLYVKKGNKETSAGPYDIAHAYWKSLITHTPEPTTNVKASEIATAFKERFDILESEAIGDPGKLGPYLTEVFSRRNRDLWKRFLLLAGAKGALALNSSLVQSSYKESIARAVANGDPLPEFHTHVESFMGSWIKAAVTEKRGRFVEPQLLSEACSGCGGQLQAYPHPKDIAKYRIRCHSCMSFRHWSCNICQTRVDTFENQGTNSLGRRCPGCGRLYRFQTLKVNSPASEEGRRLLGLVSEKCPKILDQKPVAVMELIRNHEAFPNYYANLPFKLQDQLSKMGASPVVAGKIANEFFGVDVEWVRRGAGQNFARLAPNP